MSLPVLQATPIFASIVVVVSLGVDPPWGGMVVACMAISCVAMGEMVRRTEAAMSACNRLAIPGVDDPDAVMRASAAWGADVLRRVANGESAQCAVAGAIPRVRAPVPSEVGSAASEQELNGFGQAISGDWIAAAARSVGTTPVMAEQLEGMRSQELRDAARMAAVPEGRVAIQPLPRRAASSPPRAQLLIGLNGSGY